MAGPVAPRVAAQVERSGSGLADVRELVFDKGLVIDDFVRVSLVEVEIVGNDARAAGAGIEAYLRLARAVTEIGTPNEAPATAVEPFGRAVVTPAAYAGAVAAVEAGAGPA